MKKLQWDIKNIQIHNITDREAGKQNCTSNTNERSYALSLLVTVSVITAVWMLKHLNSIEKWCDVVSRHRIASISFCHLLSGLREGHPDKCGT